MAREVEARLRLKGIDDTGKAFHSMSGRLRKTEQQLTRAGKMQRQAARFETATARTASAAWGVTARIMGPVLAAGGMAQSVRTLASFEDGLVEIQKKGGFTADQMKGISDEAKALATSGDIAVPLEEIMAAYARGAAAGLPIGELREFTLQAAKTSDAFEMSAEDAANAIMGWKANLQMTNPEIERTLDLVNGLADAGISDEKDILDFLSRSGSQLKNIGFATDDIAALGATMLNLQIESETAARGINSLTTSILAPQSKKSIAALQDLFKGSKGGYGGFRERFLKDGMAGMQEFVQQLSKLDDLEQLDLVTKVVGKDFGPMFQRLAAASDELNRNISFARDENNWLGSLDEGYRLKLSSLSSQWQLFKNQIKDTTLDLGLMGLPELKEGLSFATGQVREFGEQIQQFKFKVDMEEFEAAKTAVSELSTTVTELLNIGGDGESLIEKTFNRIASAANAVNTTINVGRDALEYLGIVEPDDETPEQERERLQKLIDDGLEWNDAVGGAVDLTDYVLNKGEWRAARKARIAGREQDKVDERVSGAFADDGGLPGREGRITITPQMPGAIDNLPVRDTGEIPIPRFYQDLPAINQDIEASTNALRQAMQDGGATIIDAGPQSGQGFADAASAGIAAKATQSGAAFGEAAAAAFNANVRVPIPTSRPELPDANRWPRGVNANLGKSMPHAGQPPESY